MFASAASNSGNELSLQRDGMAAFEALYKKYWYQLYCVAFKYTGSAPDAEELVQNLFEKIWRNRTSLQVKNWGAFLTVSLRNMVIDHHRQQAVKNKFLESYQPTAATASLAEQLDQEQLMVLIENHLHELPEKTQIIFKLSRYEHKSVKEIAGHMQLTEKAVEYHITKSLKLLRQHLSNYLNTYFTLL
ncbi:RNA polymerase sigma-70 factor [Longitalea luteola]|uniref:RNA polymerase sigma-70 factor n=1 Tax=Longitalea luteola TaxID=2812563 RepID=UPI001A96E27B|nr:RNA polymerase sigma-70 factor [Longitalea luteola]